MPSKRRVSGPRRSNRLQPCRLAETKWRLRSCSHTAELRNRCRHPLQNISNIQSSYPPIQPAGLGLELWRRSSRIFLPQVESGLPAYLYTACGKEHCEITQTECA